MNLVGISAIIEKIHAVFKVHDSRLKKLESSNLRQTMQLESRLSSAFERIHMLEQQLAMQSPKIFDELLEGKEDPELKKEIAGYFKKYPHWSLKISRNRSELIKFMKGFQPRTRNTLYGYTITWCNDQTTVGYIGESCDKNYPTKRPRIMLGDSGSLQGHNASGESMLLWDIQRRSNLIKEITYFVACNLGPYIHQFGKTKQMENELYAILGGQNGFRVSKEGDIISIEEWIQWLTTHGSLPSSIGQKYAQNIHLKEGGREHSIYDNKEAWLKFGNDSGFFL